MEQPGHVNTRDQEEPLPTTPTDPQEPDEPPAERSAESVDPPSPDAEEEIVYIECAPCLASARRHINELAEKWHQIAISGASYSEYCHGMVEDLRALADALGDGAARYSATPEGQEAITT